MGESGSGGSTSAYTVVGMYGSTPGTILFDGAHTSRKFDARARRVKRELQIVFQATGTGCAVISRSKDRTMEPELIVMLTYNDLTVKDAVELFDESKTAPAMHWGFKNVGLARGEMEKLVRKMKEAGKTTCLEVVSLTEEAGVAGARLARRCGVDVLMGTVYHDSIRDALGGGGVKYYPFLGRVHGHPNILDGTVEETVEQTLKLKARGVDGFDLLTYRYTGDPVRLLRGVVVAAAALPVVSAGSIDSYGRMKEVRDAGAWGFTIGTAFFEKRFAPDGTFGDNIAAVWDWLAGRRLPG